MERDKELKLALQEGRLYDYIRNNYHKFTSGELADVICNLEFAIYSIVGYDLDRRIQAETINTLAEQGWFENDYE